jgi:hypothetical protein
MVVDASTSAAFAWLWEYNSYERTRSYVEKNGLLLRLECEVPNTNSKICVKMKKFSQVLNVSNRLFSCWWTWRKEASGE